MGFDTYVNIGDRIAADWRKQTGQLPRLLFSRDELVVEPDSDGRQVITVEFRSTAGRVLETLDANGFGWAACIAAYGNIRSGVVAEAMFRGLYWTKLDADGVDDIESVKRTESLLADVRSAGPSKDLEELGQLLAAQWLDPELEEVLLFEELLMEEPIEVSTTLMFKVRDAAEAEHRALLPTLRAVESIAFLFGEARLVAWPLLICILVKHLPPETPVTYVLTEGIREFEIGDRASANEFVDSYWTKTGAGMADYAENLGLLFGALAQFQTGLGGQFWIGRAISALARVDELNADRANSTNKARGDALEALVDAIVRAEGPELELLERNFRTTEEEIDLILTNGLLHPFWAAQHSPIVLVECKNWAEPVGIDALRVFESKLEDRAGLARVGIFVSMSGFTKPFKERLKSIQSKSVGVIFAVTGDDLRALVSKRQRLTDWLRGEGALRAFGR